ncbi:MAG TPA: NifB/NifX family molybdenum-iron cluster-binding protein [Thermodesulfobacteriota bacterium]|nr:NifB/NifX family molybdenum-iron cluster-binding protein [Thermodesulfobacteriota bacterium]HNU70299.1 NifB/NifX family molybdenum-iron cluster-binding protein [Thermodesulfobacteriota bacterium]
MNIALSYWHNRIVPVFDVASSLLLVKVEDGREVERKKIFLHQYGPLLRSQELVELEVDVLICGAVSDSLDRSLTLSGIRVFDFVCGPVADVLDAFLTGSLKNEQSAKAFAMPGCQGRHNRIRTRRRGGHF